MLEAANLQVHSRFQTQQVLMPLTVDSGIQVAHLLCTVASETTLCAVLCML